MQVRLAKELTYRSFKSQCETGGSSTRGGLWLAARRASVPDWEVHDKLDGLDCCAAWCRGSKIACTGGLRSGK